MSNTNTSSYFYESTPKFYIIACAGSGKSRAVELVNANSQLEIVDQDKLTSRWIRDCVILPRWKEEQKADKLLSYLKTKKKPSCILASMLPSSAEDYSGIHFAVVIIPKPIHIFFLWKRRMRIFLVNILKRYRSDAIKTPAGKWNKWCDIYPHRIKIIEYSKKYNIPMFKKISDALTWAESMVSNFDNSNLKKVSKYD